MAVNFEDPAPPASAEAVADVESSLGISLAYSYKSFLSRQNGGYLQPNILPGDLGASVECFYSASDTPVEALEELVQVAHLYARDGESDNELRPGLLAIGQDEGGNLICLEVGASDTGCVYFWEHEIEPQGDAYTRLADDVEELLGALDPR